MNYNTRATGSSIGGGENNTASANQTTIGGGGLNTASANLATVGGGNINTASGDHSTIGGGYNNSASGDQSTISGGRDNSASGFKSSIGGGELNDASGTLSTIAGGYKNDASGLHSIIGGGNINNASGSTSFIGGGIDNDASGDYSVIGGGFSNTSVLDYSAVVGGKTNTANGIKSFVGGGENNTANLDFSTVSGGWSNNADKYSTVGGGFNNNASMSYSTVGGGSDNITRSDFAFIGGGVGNEIQASSDKSVIGGGQGNNIDINSALSVIGGGIFNEVKNWHSSIVNGYYNTTNGIHNSILGGLHNETNGDYSTILGGSYLKVGPGSVGYRGILGGVPILQLDVTALTNPGVGQDETVHFVDTRFWFNFTNNSLADFRIDGAAQDHLFYSEAAADNIGIGTSAPLNRLHIVGSTAADPLRIETLNPSTTENNVLVVDPLTGIVKYRDVATNPFATSTPDLDWTEIILPVGQDYLQAKAGGIASHDAILHGVNRTTHINFGLGNSGFESETGTSGQNYSYATVSGGYNNKASNDYSTVGGGYQNTASGFASFIGAGTDNIASGVKSVIVGGESNNINISHYSSIVGGRDNSILSTPPNTIIQESFIGGGNNNTINGIASASVIGGGYANTVSGGVAFIGGWSNNIAGANYALVGGGNGNNAAGAGSSIVNGQMNFNLGGNGFIGSGFANNITGSSYNFIGNGWTNKLTGDYSAILTGRFNEVDGDYSSILGGAYLKVGPRSVGYRGGIGANLTGPTILDVSSFNIPDGRQDNTFHLVDTRFWFNFTNNALADFRIDGATQNHSFYSDAATDNIGIGTANPSHRLHIVGGAGSPLRIQTLPTSTENDVLVIDANGVVTKRNVAANPFDDFDWEIVGVDVVTGHGRPYPTWDVIMVNNATIGNNLTVGNDAYVVGDALVGGILDVSGNGYFHSDIHLDGAFWDGAGTSSPGTAGQVLSSTGTTTEWVNASSLMTPDLDWTEIILPVNQDYLQAKAGGIASNSAILHGSNRTTHINFGFGTGASASETGTSGQNYSYATVSGGYNNKATNSYSTVGGGDRNTASGFKAIVGGGEFNEANNSFATISGGSGNLSSGTIAFIGGGESNKARGHGATIAGGLNNEIAGGLNREFSTIAGGSQNQIDGAYSTIAGGELLKVGHRSFGFRGGQGGGANLGNLVDVTSADTTFHIVDTRFWHNYNNYDLAHFRVDGSMDYLLYGDAMHNMIGIGTGSPSNMLHIAGGTNSNPLRIQGLATMNLPDMLVVDASGVVYKAPNNEYSDFRIKTNIRNVENSFDRILKLRPVSYNYNETFLKMHPELNDEIHFSFIAQELAEIFPESVVKSNDYLAGDSVPLLRINTKNVQIVTIQAVQDLIKLNKDLETKVADLTLQVAELTKAKQGDDMLKAKFEELQKIVLQLSNKIDGREQINTLKTASANK